MSGYTPDKTLIIPPDKYYIAYSPVFTYEPIDWLGTWNEFIAFWFNAFNFRLSSLPRWKRTLPYMHKRQPQWEPYKRYKPCK